MICQQKDFFGLPFRSLNRILSFTLENEAVHLSEATHVHIAERHPNDYARCMEWLADTIAIPDFAGETPRHPDNFFLIKEYEERILLAAISKHLSPFDKYPLQSCYLLDRHALRRRIRKGYVKPL